MQALSRAVLNALHTDYTHTYHTIILWICDKKFPQTLLTLCSHRDINTIEDSRHLVNTYLSSRPDSSFRLRTVPQKTSQVFCTF
jgi:hypothetical protein